MPGVILGKKSQKFGKNACAKKYSGEEKRRRRRRKRMHAPTLQTKTKWRFLERREKKCMNYCLASFLHDFQKSIFVT